MLDWELSWTSDLPSAGGTTRQGMWVSTLHKRTHKTVAKILSQSGNKPQHSESWIFLVEKRKGSRICDERYAINDCTKWSKSGEVLLWGLDFCRCALMGQVMECGISSVVSVRLRSYLSLFLSTSVTRIESFLHRCFIAFPLSGQNPGLQASLGDLRSGIPNIFSSAWNKCFACPACRLGYFYNSIKF